MFDNILNNKIQTVVSELFPLDIDSQLIQLQRTRVGFEGDVTLITFPLTKILSEAPQNIAKKIGEGLLQHPLTQNSFCKYNVVQGFLNLSLTSTFLIEQLLEMVATPNFGYQIKSDTAPLMVIEYSSPNTNKPLHLGHIRNNILGHSIAKIEQVNGWNIIKTNIVNDRGIHICKSMLAWLKYGNGETPETTHQKGDHLVGDYYVRFNNEYKKQVQALIQQGITEEEAETQAPLMREAREMLKKWEDNDKPTRELWEKMNLWVYNGFDETYKRLGISFDKIYYESQTFLDGKKEVYRGLKEGIFYQKEDGSVWADLHKYGLDDKLLLRADGTSVYITQDIGTAKQRYLDYKIDKMVYVVGNEQEHHFKVLSVVLDMLGFPFGKELMHFSYGMVELPNGKMKSREGTVVDADDLIDEMIRCAKQLNNDKVNTLPDLSEEEIEEISTKVGLGALKYYILKVDPKKNIVFDPDKSIDFTGNTGSFIQYTYARIRSILRKCKDEEFLKETKLVSSVSDIHNRERSLILRIADFPSIIQEAGKTFSPAVVANYAYELACDFNSFYHACSILNEPDASKRHLRLLIAYLVSDILYRSFDLLGIEMPERM